MPKIELTKEQLTVLRNALYRCSLQMAIDIAVVLDRALAEPEQPRQPVKWPESSCGGRYLHSEDGTYRCTICNKWKEEHA